MRPAGCPLRRDGTQLALQRSVLEFGGKRRSGTDLHPFLPLLPGTMFRFPFLSSASRRSLSPWHRAALFGAGLVVLWLALQLAPASSPPPATPRSEAASERLPARTAPDGPAAERLTAIPTQPTRSLFRTGNVLAVLLLVAGGAGAVYLRRRRPGTDTPEAAPSMATLGTLPLGPNHTLRLVRIGDEVMLLGLAQGGVSLLQRYDADEAPVAIDAPVSAPALDFEALLQRFQTPHAHG